MLTDEDNKKMEGFLNKLKVEEKKRKPNQSKKKQQKINKLMRFLKK